MPVPDKHASDVAQPQVAQRWVDTTHELTTRRVLAGRTVVILASDGTVAPVHAETQRKLGRKQEEDLVQCRRTSAVLERVTAHIFSDLEQGELLGNSFRIEPQRADADLKSQCSLQTKNIVLDLDDGNTSQASDKNEAAISQAEFADRFRAVRFWAPHRVLSQFVVDTCRASLPPEPDPEPYKGHKRRRYSSLPIAVPGIALGPSSTLLDLNAGTGVCGIFAACGLKVLGSRGHVYLADRCTATLPLLELNSGLNSNRIQTSICALNPVASSEVTSCHKYELQGIGGTSPPLDTSVDAIVSVLDPFEGEDEHGGATEAFQLWSVIGRYLSMAPGAWVAFACVEASTLFMSEGGDVVGLRRKSVDGCAASYGQTLSGLATKVLQEASNHGFELHHSQPTVRCLPGAHRERSIRVVVFSRKRAHQPHPTDAVLTPPFAGVASRLSPLAHALLIERCDPSKVSADELLDSIDAISPSDKVGARLALHGSARRAAHRVVVLSKDQCEVLCNYCRAHLQMEPDSVDGAPDSQVQLTRAKLQGLVGAETVQQLWRLPAAAALMSESHWTGTVDCFIRRYTAESRPFIPFHCDGAVATVNVALTASAGNAMGGELLCLHSGRVVVERRREGEATVHPAALLHGVTRLEHGAPERFTMILFFEPPIVQPT